MLIFIKNKKNSISKPIFHFDIFRKVKELNEKSKKMGKNKRMISQEVRKNILEMNALHGLRNSFENLELLFAGLFNLHDCSQVVASVTVVRGAPHCHQVLILNLS